jgi:glutamate-1-semialdehyde 2,1-aminomutase
MDHDLEAVIHLYLTNRGILLAPFHNMMLLSPVTEPVQVDRLLQEMDNCVAELLEAEA